MRHAAKSHTKAPIAEPNKRPMHISPPDKAETTEPLCQIRDGLRSPAEGLSADERSNVARSQFMVKKILIPVRSFHTGRSEMRRIENAC
jgi:hypothetical protein